MTSTKKSRFSRRLATGSFAIMAAMTLAACSGGAEGPEEEETPSSGQQGGSVTIVSAAPMTSWDPIVQSLPTIPGIGTDRMLAVYGALLYVDADGAVQPEIAESLTTEDFTVWTLKLNPDVTFTDDTPFDAEAVKVNYDRAAGEGSVLVGIAGSFSSEVIDETTLEITLDEANPVFDRVLAESLPYIASPTALEEQGDNYVEPVGAGPFILEEWDQAVGETLSRNPDYFEEGKPYLDELKFTVIADPAQRVTTVVQGGAEIMNNYRFAVLDVLEQPGIETTAVESGGIRHFVFNTEIAPFDDVRARQAVALATNAEELTQTLTQDPEDGAWTGLFSDTSQLRAEEFDLEVGDTEAASALVEELEGDGVQTSFRIVAAAVPELIRAAELLQIQLNEVGFDVSIEQVPLADWAVTVRERRDFELTFYPGIYDLNNAPVSMTNLFEGGENIAGYESAEMSDALQRAREATSDEDQQAAFADVQEVYSQDVPFVVFGIDERLYLHNADVEGFEPIGRGMLLTKELYRTDL